MGASKSSCFHGNCAVKLRCAETAVAYAEPKAIAEQGFQFLLLDTYSQLWLLLQQYIANAQKKAGAQQLLLLE